MHAGEKYEKSKLTTHRDLRRISALLLVTTDAVVSLLVTKFRSGIVHATSRGPFSPSLLPAPDIYKLRWCWSCEHHVDECHHYLYSRLHRQDTPLLMHTIISYIRGLCCAVLFVPTASAASLLFSTRNRCSLTQQHITRKRGGTHKHHHQVLSFVVDHLFARFLHLLHASPRHLISLFCWSAAV